MIMSILRLPIDTSGSLSSSSPVRPIDTSGPAGPTGPRGPGTTIGFLDC